MAGHVYGISSAKSLIRVAPTAANLGAITGDAIFTAGTISNDAFFDNAGNIYTVISNAGSYYIYAININSLIAYQVKQITGMPANFNFQGLAYDPATNSIFTCMGFSSSVVLLTWNNAKIYKISMATGAATFVSDQQLNTFVGPFSAADALDMASCGVYNAPTAAFAFNCGAASLQLGSFLANGSIGQTGIVRVPISGITTSGNATFTITSAATGIVANPSSYTAYIANGATYVDIPVTYDGSGTAGTRAVTVASSQGTGTCTFNVNVTTIVDTDGDGVANSIDIDDDNDGITDVVECPILTSGDIVGWYNNAGTFAASPTAAQVSAATPMVAGSGLVMTTGAAGTSRDFSSINAANSIQAIANNEYVEYGFTVSPTATFKQISRIDYFRNYAVGTYYFLVAISNDNFVTLLHYSRLLRQLR
jgi:hypothetical protein